MICDVQSVVADSHIEISYVRKNIKLCGISQFESMPGWYIWVNKDGTQIVYSQRLNSIEEAQVLLKYIMENDIDLNNTDYATS